MENSLSDAAFCLLFPENNVYVSTKDSTSFKFCESFNFLLSVFIQKF